MGAVEMIQAEAEAERKRAPARRFKDFRYATQDSWSRRRRVVGKADAWQGQPALRRDVVSKARIGARDLYERLYCARGEMENRLKECPTAPQLGANQLLAEMCALLDTELLGLHFDEARRISSFPPRRTGAWLPFAFSWRAARRPDTRRRSASRAAKPSPPEPRC